MNIVRFILSLCVVVSLTSCDEIAKQLGYVSSDSAAKAPKETEAQKVQKEKNKVKENIANYVKIVWGNGSYWIKNDTDYTLEKVSVMTSWTQPRPGEYWKKDGYQEPRQFTFIPAHSTSTSIEYDKYEMKDMKGQIYEIKCSALGL